MTQSKSSKNNWQTVWSKKAPEAGGSDLLSSLIRADGFDSGFSFYTPDDWLQMVDDAARRAGVSGASQVLEIGCGSGAFLYALHQSRGCSISGLDYSPSLVEAARKHLPHGKFVITEATSIPFEVATFDSIFSHGVFFYFPDQAYAEAVLREAHRTLKPGGFLCLMDMNDKQFEAAYLEERRGMFATQEEYEVKYDGLPHLFFDRDELVDSLHEAGFQAVDFFNHRVASYEPARYRFNLVAAKGLAAGHPE